jgi:hypothetical protein
MRSLPAPVPYVVALLLLGQYRAELFPEIGRYRCLPYFPVTERPFK